MKPIVIVIDDRRREELYSKLSYLSSMIPIRQERRRDAIGISDGLLRPVLIIGKYRRLDRLAGLRPDFWIAGDDDGRAMLKMSASKIGGVELNRIEDVLKIVEILRVEGEGTDQIRQLKKNVFRSHFLGIRTMYIAIIVNIFMTA